MDLEQPHPPAPNEPGTDTREQVRRRYRAAATAVLSADTTRGCCGNTALTSLDNARGDIAPTSRDTCCGDGCGQNGFGSALYDIDQHGEVPQAAIEASLGCGNPLAVADLHAGETVLDLGSGGGIDVLLSARRVGPTGKAYGLDMTPEMLDLARRNALQAGLTNVEFLDGYIEDIPLPEASVDVIISNCVINLSTDKPAVFSAMHRVLRAGGRIGITDVVADNHLTVQQRGERGAWVGCIAGALSFTEYAHGLAAAGFTDIEISPTHQVADGMHSAMVRARKPGGSQARPGSWLSLDKI
jgi:arsenite methyltransferase